MRNIAAFTFIVLLAVAPSFAVACDSHAASGDAKGACPMGDHGKSCPMKDKKVASSSDVEMTGTVVCAHCDLHKEKSCRKVFQSSTDKAVYDICPGSDMKSVEAAGDKALIQVSGKVVKAEDGTQVIEIKSAKKAS